MRILLDENVPRAAFEAMRACLKFDEVSWVKTMPGWEGKTDTQLLRDASRKGYELFVTNDLKQLRDDKEYRAIKRSRMHHATYSSVDDPPSLVAALLCYHMPKLLKELERLDGPHRCSFPKLSASELTLSPL